LEISRRSSSFGPLDGARRRKSVIYANDFLYGAWRRLPCQNRTTCRVSCLLECVTDDWRRAGTPGDGGGPVEERAMERRRRPAMQPRQWKEGQRDRSVIRSLTTTLSACTCCVRDAGTTTALWRNETGIEMKKLHISKKKKS